jgi:UDP-glucose 4-epimerase
LKFVVTGGSGFIGSNLANTLVGLDLGNIGQDRKGVIDAVSKSISKIEEDRNDNNCHNKQNKKDTSCLNQVIAVDDLSFGTTSNLSSEVQFIEGSVMDGELMLSLTRDCDYVFHQAAVSSSPMFVDDPRRGLNVNVMGFMNVMESAKRNKVKKVIYASSSSLYNGLPRPYNEFAAISPKTFYESSFLCREVIAKTYFLEDALDSVGLRYFSVYGPKEKHKGKFANNISQFIWDIQKQKNPVVYGNGSQSRDFTYIEDVIQANILAMIRDEQQQKDRPYTYFENESSNHRAPYNIYNVGTGTETSFNRVIEIINKLLGTEIGPKYVNNPIHNYVHHTRADISMARSELGYEPIWKDVEKGIEELLSNSYSPQFVRT